jgi:GT2 family glycosyltransferase
VIEASSIIIPVYNQPEHTAECLAAVREQTAGEFEVLVVDNGSGRETAKLLGEARSWFKRCEVLRNETNLGFTLAANQGLRAARGQYLVLLNNDVVVTDGWLEGLIRMAEGDDTIGLVGPKIINANTRRLQGIGGLVFTKRGARAPYGEHGDPGDSQFAAPRDCQYLEGSCLLLKRAVVEAIGYLDEAFAPAYYEDTDYCFRAREAGFRVVYSPYATVYHYATVTTQAIQAEGFPLGPVAARNHRLFLQRWAHQFL